MGQAAQLQLFLDICQGLGLAAAVGLRPFLAAIAAGGIAIADWSLDLDGTRYAFLEDPFWLVALAVLMVLTFALRRVQTHGPTEAAIGGMAVGLGALLFAGTLADHGRDGWGWTLLGLFGGALAAALAQAAVRDLARRVGTRLDEQARRALPLWFEAVGLVLAGLSLAIPPISLVALAALAWLLAGGRRREGAKYAGLRILR